MKKIDNTGFSLRSNKRAFLLAEETLKIIIAVIAIVFLIGFITALYMTFQSGQKEKEAQATLEKLKEAIDNNQDEFVIYNPKDWLLISWPLEGESVSPRICSINQWENCLCISSARFTKRVGNLAEESKSCVEISERIIVKGDWRFLKFGPDEQGAMMIDPGMAITINKQDDKIVIQRK